MKAISLWQPWASAVAIGAKNYETRSWRTSFRGTLAIHAAKKRSPAGKVFFTQHHAVFARAGIHYFEDLSFGCVLLTCQLGDCVATEVLRGSISDTELAFGDYSDGRFAWRLVDVQRLATPVPARGAQGFWRWDANALRSSASRQGRGM